jgi:RNAse (barnase) inhibitor barstar
MPFEFGSETRSQPSTHAHVPVGIVTKDSLMDALAAVLSFPDYFGRNWDALEECIRDLSWLPPGPVVLEHEDLPLRHDERALATYLAILVGAVEKVQGTERQLVVVFPATTEAEVRSAMPRAGRP